jgi:membrane protease YdiL (CAAX protease family)
MSFFKRYSKRGSYDLFSNYEHYTPGMGGMFGLLGLFLAGGLLGNLVLLAMQAFLPEVASDYGMLVSYPLMFIPAMLYASARSRLDMYNTPEIPLDRNDFSPYGGLKLTFVAIAATIAMAYIVEPVVTLLPQMPQWLEDTMKQLLEESPVWISLISVSVFAPFFEEWLCRGIILRGLLSRNMSPAWAIVISSVFFAVIHMNPWQAIPAFALGALCGYAYYRTGSLKLTMLMHCVNNTMALVISKIPQFKGAETFMDILSPWAYWSIFALCVVIVISSVLIWSTMPVGHKKAA